MTFDVIIRGGQVLDGSAADARQADIGITGDRIVSVGAIPEDAGAGVVIDAAGMTVSPGFVNMLSHAYYSLLQDGRGLSDLVQGVTTEVFSEEPPVGPLNNDMRVRANRTLRAAGYTVEASWSNVAEYLDLLKGSRTAMNVCAFTGIWALREARMGLDRRPPTPDELRRMIGLLNEQMEGGSFGIGSALIYPPANYTTTDELVDLCTAAARFGGRYHSHIRSEGDGLLEAMHELIEIGDRAGLPVEPHHLKVAGGNNWPKLDEALQLLESARSRGPVSVNMYTFNAGGTGLFYAIPARFHDGGRDRLRERLRDPAVRADIRGEIESEGGDWENLYRMSGGASGVRLLMTEAPRFAPFRGQALSEIGEQLDIDPLDVLMDIAQEDESGAMAAFFIISEDNVRRQVQVPWVTFGSDAPADAMDEPFTRSPTHPRTYANFTRLLEHYVRDERLVTLPEAIRRLTSLPCETLGLEARGRLAEGFHADVVVFDLDKLHAPATYSESHQYATGVRDMLVNGVAALRDGRPTGALPGRPIYGLGRAGL